VCRVSCRVSGWLPAACILHRVWVWGVGLAACGDGVEGRALPRNGGTCVNTVRRRYRIVGIDNDDYDDYDDYDDNDDNDDYDDNDDNDACSCG
jgi:hypothetical protein